MCGRFTIQYSWADLSLGTNTRFCLKLCGGVATDVL